MNISSKHQNGKSAAVPALPPEDEFGRLTHNLMGSISALLMCEHMLGKELASTQEYNGNPILRTTLSLLKETTNQIRDYGDQLMGVSNQMRKARKPEA